MRVPNKCRGRVAWYRRGGHIDCEQCSDQIRKDHMLWCAKYGNVNDPSVIVDKRINPRTENWDRRL
jgi:hypothetical protein